MNTDEMKHSELTERIIAVYYRVYNDLGPGFLESIYHRAMTIAMAEEGLRVEEQLPIPVWYRGQQLGDFRADILVNGCVLLELKAVEHLDRSHSAQTLNYLRATDLEVALLLNFGHTRPEFRRLLFDNDKKRGRAQVKTATAS
jgi:GxxExxY protein